MDQPSVQHDPVVTIPPATDASSISSSSAAVGFQALNSPSVVPREGVVIDVSTSAANTRSRSRAPRQQRNRWLTPCFWMTIDFCITSFQIILLVVVLSVFHEEHPPVALLVWVIAYGVACFATLPLLYYRYKHSQEQSNQLPEAISISRGTEVGESQTGRRRRFGKILQWLQVVFFVLWWWVGTLILSSQRASKEASHLNRLCTTLVVYTFFRYCRLLPIYVWMRWLGTSLAVLSFPERPRGASANVISALPTYRFHSQLVSSDPEIHQANNKELKEDVEDSIGGEEERVGGAPAAAAEVVVAECCICLDLYRDGVVVKELPCAHHFHGECIDQWLKINATCPICKRWSYL